MDELVAEGATAATVATGRLDGPGRGDVAYVIHTSGSTGVPKGVAVTHSNLAHSTAARPAHYSGRVGGFLVSSSLAFDSSLAGLCWALWDGGTVVLPDDDRRLDVLHFADLIERNGVTHLLTLPAVHRLLLDEVATDRLAGLSAVIVAGEACPPALVARHRQQLPTVELHNEYGPTEGTVWSHVCRLDDLASIDGDGARVPIGRPIPGASCVVLDRFGRRTPIGVPGELIIGGRGVAVGYVGRTDETAAAFVDLPDVLGAQGRHYRTGDIVAWRSDGLLDYLGRVDGQVKVRGHRVELAEVKAAVERHPSIRTAVASVDDPAGDEARRRIVVWYESDAPVTVDSWRSHVVAALPAAMHPTVFVPVTDWPTTSTGKIDRAALSVPARLADPGDGSGDGTGSAGGRRHRGPSDDLESALLEVWESVLVAGSNGAGEIGVDDDFFDLGGNSIDAMRLFARIERRFGRDLPLATLFERPTVALLAEPLRDESGDVEAESTSNSSLVFISPHGSKRPLYLIGPHQISVLELGKIAKYFDSERPFFGLQAPGFAPGEPVLDSIPDIANHLVATVREHQPEGPYLIGGHCDGCWTAYEMARQFSDAGEEVAYVGMIDLPPPHDEMPEEPTARRLAERARYYWSDGRLWHALSWKVRKWLEREVILRVGGAAARRERAVRVAHQIAFDEYELRHDHRVPIHLIRSSEMADLMDRAPWYRQLGAEGQQVTKTDIESTHARLLMEPETAEVAAALQETLDAVDP